MSGGGEDAAVGMETQAIYVSLYVACVHKLPALKQHVLYTIDPREHAWDAC